jgi:hypothetical protein
MIPFRTVPAVAFALLLATTLTRPARAQIDRQYPPAVEAHEAGRWSLQFTIADNFQLGSFAGAGMSITKNTSPHGAWQLGLTYDARTTDQSQELQGPGVPPPPRDYGREDDALALDLSLLRLHRYQPDRRIGLQLGLGPSLSYLHQKSEIDDQQTFQTTHSEFTTTGYAIGVDAALGTEVFVATAISLHARYNGSLDYTHRTDSREDTITDTSGGPATVTIQSDDRTLHGWSLVSQGVTFGVSVYF